MRLIGLTVVHEFDPTGPLESSNGPLGGGGPKLDLYFTHRTLVWCKDVRGLAAGGRRDGCGRGRTAQVVRKTAAPCRTRRKDACNLGASSSLDGCGLTVQEKPTCRTMHKLMHWRSIIFSSCKKAEKAEKAFENDIFLTSSIRKCTKSI